MKKEIDTGIAPPVQAFSRAIVSDGLMVTVQGPFSETGEVIKGTASDQTAITLGNLRRTLAAAKVTPDDVIHVQIVVADPVDLGMVDAIYRSLFTKPLPCRQVIIAQIPTPDTRLELTAWVRVPQI